MSKYKKDFNPVVCQGCKEIAFYMKKGKEAGDDINVGDIVKKGNVQFNKGEFIACGHCGFKGNIMDPIRYGWILER